MDDYGSPKNESLLGFLKNLGIKLNTYNPNIMVGMEGGSFSMVMKLIKENSMNLC